MATNQKPAPAKKAATAPVQKYRAGGISVDIWENESEKGPFLTVSFQRSYMDKENNWQHTQSLRVNDLPTLGMLLNKAFEFAKTLKRDEQAE